MKGVASVLTVLSITSALVGCQQPQTSGIKTGAAVGGILGGQDATGTEAFASSVVALYDVEVGALCTASILNEQYLVTAAHCVASQAKSLRVVFGLDLTDEKAELVIRQVTAYRTSPGWESNSEAEKNTGDIAIVKFTGGLAPGFKAATLLKSVDSMKTGDTVLLAGYGASKVDLSTGEGNHTESGKLRWVDGIKIEDAKFSETEVLLNQNDGRGACHGDSGGPAYIKVGDQLQLWGVTSRGNMDPQDSCQKFSVYTNILAHTKWIEAAVNALTKESAMLWAPRSVASGEQELSSAPPSWFDRLWLLRGQSCSGIFSGITKVIGRPQETAAFLWQAAALALFQPNPHPNHLRDKVRKREMAVP